MKIKVILIFIQYRGLFEIFNVQSEFIRATIQDYLFIYDQSLRIVLNFFFYFLDEVRWNRQLRVAHLIMSKSILLPPTDLAANGLLLLLLLMMMMELSFFCCCCCFVADDDDPDGDDHYDEDDDADNIKNALNLMCVFLMQIL